MAITVGTPGLGYPLLLCLGKRSFVVILNYVQQPDPCGPEVLFTRQRSRTRPLVGKGPGAPGVPEEAGAQPEQPEALDLPWRSGSPRNPGPPFGVSDPLYSDRTPRQGKESTPRLEVVRGRHVSASADTYIKPLGLHIKVHLPLYSLRWEDIRIDVAEAEAIL